MNLTSNQGIKVLRVNVDDGSLWSCHGGDMKWSGPTIGPDGSVLPGEWTPEVTPNLCSKGYHLTDLRGLVRWFDLSNLRAYLAEYRGEVSGSFNDDSRDRKISVESCRLIRPLSDEEHAAHGVFLSGTHEVYEGWCRAAVTAVVYAYGKSVVYAYGNAMVYAEGNAMVYAEGNAMVYAEGNSVVYAYGNAKVYAEGNSVVTASGDAEVTASGDAEVSAYGNHKGVITRNP